MCLITSEKNGWVAREPKVCYKVYNRDEDVYASPIVGVRYKLKPGDEVVAEGILTVREHGFFRQDGFMIMEGAIHAFKGFFLALVAGLTSTGRAHHMVQCLSAYIDREEWEFADKEMERIKQYINERFVVCLMEIPEGETYWMGNEDICARRMIFREEVDLSWELLIDALILCCPHWNYTHQLESLALYKEKIKGG